MLNLCQRLSDYIYFLFYSAVQDRLNIVPEELFGASWVADMPHMMQTNPHYQSFLLHTMLRGRHFYSNKVWHQNTHLMPNICSQIMKTQKASTPLPVQHSILTKPHACAHYMINYYETFKFVQWKFCWCCATVSTLFVGFPKTTQVL